MKTSFQSGYCHASLARGSRRRLFAKVLSVVGPASAVLLGTVGYAHAITYYVDTSSIPAGEIRSSDGYCSLAEAVAAANAGANQYNCTGSGSGSGTQTIVLRQASGKSFSAYPYNIGALTINSPGRVVSIQSEGGRARINFTSNSTNTNAFYVRTLAQFWSLDMTHTGTTGRFIYIRAGAAADVYNSTLSGGNVTGFSNGYGGAIQNLGTLSLGFGTQLTNNAADNGGAIYNQNGRINVSDVTLEGNSATRAGGGIYNISTTPTGPSDGRGTAYISGTGMKIRNNTAPAGGGVFNRGSQVVLSGPQIRDNTASGSGSGETCHSGTSCDGNGAGALNISISSSGIGAYFEMTSADISGNSAAGRGGGVYVGGEVTLYNTAVSSNNALTGGALYVIQDTPVRYCEVRTINGGTATIEYNDATASWGFSVLDGDGTSGEGGAHCKFYNPAGGTFNDQGQARSDVKAAICVSERPRLLYMSTDTVTNTSDTEPAEYVVARDSPTEDSVEVPWADQPT